MPITEQQLLMILPNAGRQAGVFVPALNAAMSRYAILSRLRIAAFISQIGHESGQLTRLVESLSYKADRIIALGNAAPPGSRWRSLAPRAAELAGSSVRMGNAVYGGRLGNGLESSGDGFKFRGRGLIQITGKDNYLKCGEALGLNLISQPELLEQPQYAAFSAAWYWSFNDLNTLADTGDIQNIGSIINTGGKGKIPNGTVDRLALYQVALRVLV
ncbi:glycoside hydrolase family 19 protein [Pseudomonas fluorescens]|uniref:glycoside hydrolase family 19 protein n=1 Tax=Pseudomonas fluorescens TaxID=294 RepID=UPI0019036ACC|nr:glycoside hydrolase family 19 protein [Pseudomonas fluorescens]MBD8091743.1 glycoside hydrolase family 19 protein [Pseudomonas fluorescens]MBD8716134.1 glycoside hydrolase family 19 protein [Pseudomonas fluorescens]